MYFNSNPKIKEMIKQKILLTILSLIFLYSCSNNESKEIEGVIKKEESNYSSVIEEQDSNISSTINFSEIETTFNFKVKDEQNRSLKNAKILVNNIEKSTDELGNVSFENISVNDNYVVVNISKEGYEKSLKTITPSRNSELTVDFTLIEEKASLILNAKEGGELESDGVRLSFSEASLIYENGEVYQGKASVKIVYFNPKSRNFLTISPGNLVGVTNDNQEVGLISEGMLDVHITDASGEVLRIANDKKVKVTMPTNHESKNEIPFWHLSEKYGIWYEEGKAIKKGNTYEFEVSHFSRYNLDYTVPDTVNFCVKLSGLFGRQIRNTKIILEEEDGSRREVVTDDKGEIHFMLAKKGTYKFIYKGITKTINVNSSNTDNCFRILINGTGGSGGSGKSSEIK